MWPRVVLPEPVAPRMEIRDPMDSWLCIAGVVYLTGLDQTSAQARLLDSPRCMSQCHGAMARRREPRGAFCQYRNVLHRLYCRTTMSPYAHRQDAQMPDR